MPVCTFGAGFEEELDTHSEVNALASWRYPSAAGKRAIGMPNARRLSVTVVVVPSSEWLSARCFEIGEPAKDDTHVRHR
jgi:hypothetical protein